MQRRDRGLAQALGDSLTKKIKKSRVLLVGAGGIGCELLKNLVCCGFGSGYVDPSAKNGTHDGPAGNAQPTRKPGIVVIDLDTIDLSNLNRQFLFRKQHISSSKAFVAKDTVSRFNPSVSIDAHHADIVAKQYDVDFFAGFDVVFNALDNLKARRHVNRMCLAANVPLIESGTTGFNGQVQAIKKGVTECYDCNEKPVQKSFAICTIRSTPSQPIHCIVWAKSYLLPELFGKIEDSEMDSADVAVTSDDNAEEVAKLKEEAEALKKLRTLTGQPDFAKEVYNKVFHDDIERLRSMEEMWQTRSPPKSLCFESINIDKDPVGQGEFLSTQDQAIWSIHDNLKVFCHSVQRLSKRIQAGEDGIAFDKDDKETLDFVASAANLRSYCFGISAKSEWDIKQMAGNIIPAIATSNALTASLCVMQAFKILRVPIQRQFDAAGTGNARQNGAVDTAGSLGNAKMVFLTSKSTDRLVTGENLATPKASCPVCSPVYARLRISQKSRPTLQQLVDLLTARFGYEEFSISVGDSLFYDPDEQDNLEKPLSELGIPGDQNNFIVVTDDGDTPKVDLVLSAKTCETDDEELQLVSEIADLPLKPPKASEANGDGENDIEGGVAAVALGSVKKRKRDAEDDLESSEAKRAKAGNAVIEVKDDNGAILLD